MPTVKAAGITAKINVNTVDARSSVNMLKRSIRELTQDWKNDYRALTAAGRSEDALKRKHQGLVDVQHQLKQSIDEVTGAIERSKDSSGTKKYQQTVVDLKRMVIQLKGVNHQLKHNEDVMLLHNDAIRRSDQTLLHHKEVDQQLIEQYRLEGNTVEVENLKMESRKQKLHDLTIAEQQYTGTINRAKKTGTDQRVKTDYNKDVERLAQIKAAKARVKREDMLSNNALLKLQSTERLHAKYNDRLIQNYRAEGKEIVADNQKVAGYKVRLRDLNKVQRELADTVNFAKRAGYGNDQQVKQWRKDYADNKTEILELNRALALNEDKLKQAMTASENYRVINQELVKQYKAQGQAMTANSKAVEGYKERLRDLKIVQKELTESMARAEHNGQTETDTYKKWTRQLAESKTEVAQLNKAIALNDGQLQQDMKTATDHRIINQQLVNQYKAQGQSLKANSQTLTMYDTRLKDLSKVQSDLAQNMAKAERQGLTGTDTYRKFTRQMAQAKTETSELTKAQKELAAGLTSGKQYNDYYNQSTEKVVSSLKESKQNAMAARVEYVRLSRNLANETAVIDRQRTVALRAANANRTQADVTGKQSVEYQKQSSILEGLIATERKHKYQMGQIKKNYGLMSAKGAASYDTLNIHMNKLDHEAHNSLRTAHALTNGGIALGAAFYYGAKQSIGLQHEFNKTGVLAQNSGEKIGQVRTNIRGMTNDATNLSEKYGVSQQKIANGFETLIRRGYSSGQALSSMQYYLKASTASGEDLTDVIHTAGSTIEGFDLRNKNLGHNTKVVTNELAAGADFSASSFHDMGVAMSYTGSIAHGTGQSISQTSAALGVLANNSIKGSMAGTSLRRILGNLASFKSNNKVLKSLGLTPKDFQTSTGSLRNISTIVETLHNKMKGMGKAKQTSIMTQLFGRNAENAARVLTNNADAVGKLDTKVSHATKNGYTNKTSRENMKSTEGQLLRLKMSATQLAREYSDGLRPAFSKLADVAITLSKVLGVLPKPVRSLVSVASLAIPALAALAYGIATVKKTASIWYKIQRDGVKSLFTGKNAIEENSDILHGHISVLDKDTSAIRQNNQEKQRAINLTKQFNSSLDQDSKTTSGNTSVKTENTNANENNSASEANDTKVTDANANAQRTDASATGLNNETKLKNAGAGNAGQDISNEVNGGSRSTRANNKSTMLSRAGSHLNVKSGLAAGAFMGGTDLLSGEGVSKAANDTVGTTGGMIGGGAIGAAITPMSPEIGSAIGSAIGAYAGPEVTKVMGRVLSPVANRVGKAADSRTITKNGDMRNSVRNKEDDPKVQAQTVHDLQQRNSINANYGVKAQTQLDKLSKSSSQFVMNESKLEQKAEENYIEHDNHLSRTAKGYYNHMYAEAEQYEHKRLRRKDIALKHLSQLSKKAGGITQKQYQNRLHEQNKAYENHLKAFRKNEKAIMTDDNKNRKQRAKDIKSLNDKILKMTDKGTKKDYALKRNLADRTTKLNQKSYDKVVQQATKAQQETDRQARKTYRAKASEARKDYTTTLKDAKDVYGVHSKMYEHIQSVAGRHKSDMISNARQQEKDTYSHARSQRNNVVKEAGKQADQSVDKADYGRRGVVGAISNIFSGIGKVISGIAHFGGSSGFHRRADGTPDTYAIHLANGFMGDENGKLTGLSQSEKAVVNDGDGQELIRYPNGRLALPQGHNVHTVLPKGTSVFNAGQTRRLLGHNQQQAIHLAGGNVGETPTSNGSSKKSSLNIKTPSGGLKKTEKDTKTSMKNIHDMLDKGYKKTGKDVQKRLDDLHDNTDDNWNDTFKLTKKHVKKIHDDTINRYSDLKDNIGDIENKSNAKTDTSLDTTTRYFRHHFAMIPPITRSSMKAGISNINGGISAIDQVLAKFGGNSHVLSMAHYAGGTSGPSMTKQLAMLNDATGGPTQEAIVSDSGKVRMPKGRNVVTTLNPGDKVMNGADTLKAIKSGLIPHYAGGLKSTDALRSLAKHYAKAPVSFTNDTFNKLSETVGSLFAQDLTHDTKNGAQTPANNWSNAMWKYIDTLINPDNSVLVQKMHELGDGRKYRLGSTGPNAYDCGSLVHAALAALGIHSGTNAPMINHDFPRIPRSEAGPGDIVGNNSHVGVVDSQGAKTYFSAFNSHSHPNILTNPCTPEYFDGNPIWFSRVPGLKKYNHEQQQVDDNPLTSLVKRELGSKASGWIHANLGNEDGAAGLAGGSGVIARAWNEFAKLGLDTHQIEGVLGGALQESNYNPTVIASDGGQGLYQATPPYGNVIAYAHRNGLNWKDPAVQSKYYYLHWLQPSGYLDTHGSIYSEAMHAAEVEASSNANGGLSSTSNFNNRLSGAHKMAAWYSAHRGSTKGYANGGMSVQDKMAHISEGNHAEMVLPLTDKSRSVELMLKSLEYMFGGDQNSNQSSRQNQQSNEQAIQDRRFEQDLIQSNQKKDRLINEILGKMTLLIKTVQQKPVISSTDIYNANRNMTIQKSRLRNFNRGTF